MDGSYKRGKNNKQLNVLGGDLEPCISSHDKNEIVTGFYRDNCCNTGPDDFGLHTVCCIMTKSFLTFSKSVGNDLSTPIPEYNFKGLKEGDKWCLCVSRWIEAYRADVAPPIILESSHIKTLEYISIEILEKFNFNNYQ